MFRSVSIFWFWSALPSASGPIRGYSMKYRKIERGTMKYPPELKTKVLSVEDLFPCTLLPVLVAASIDEGPKGGCELRT